MASMAGKSPQPWLSVYAATKAAVIAYTQAMNKELNGEGVKSVAFCPGFVDTDMSDFVKQSIAAEDMLRTTDVGEALRFLLRALAELRGAGDRLPAAGRDDLSSPGQVSTSVAAAAFLDELASGRTPVAHRREVSEERLDSRGIGRIASPCLAIPARRIRGLQCGDLVDCVE